MDWLDWCSVISRCSWRGIYFVFYPPAQSQIEPQPHKTAHLQTARVDSQTKVCKRTVFLPSLLINLKAIGIKCVPTVKKFTLNLPLKEYECYHPYIFYFHPVLWSSGNSANNFIISKETNKTIQYFSFSNKSLLFHFNNSSVIFNNSSS